MTKRVLCIALMLFSSAVLFAQTTITGTVKDASIGDPLPGASIKIARKALGTTTDFDGNFTLNVSDTPPFTIEVSSIGFKTERIEITKNNQVVVVSLKENATALDEVVVSASRTPERIMESPVTVERMDIRAIRNTASASFYDGLEDLKGVDVNANSLTFKSVNTRGFATFSNTRFMQLVDGMDNSSPALNFAIGNLLGMSELDVKTVELLPGASSALYGANAFNGIMFMYSKNPFDAQGLSTSVKSGITSQEAAGNNLFYDVGFRWAKAFSNKFAAKITVSYLEGTEFYATDYRNTSGIGAEYKAGTRASDINYDGLNVYGDEVTTNIYGVAQAMIAAGILPAGAEAAIPQVNVSRTGYNDVDLMTNEAKSMKMGASFNYRPYGDDRLEIIWNSKIGTGNTIYQGLNRYNIKNFFMGQHKLEAKGKNFLARAYMTTEGAGDSYDTRFTAININRKWNPDATWFGEYVGTYFQAVNGILPGTTGPLNNDQAHAVARGYADRNRYAPGSDAFNTAMAEVTSDGNLATGSKFTDNTKLYHADLNYNLQDITDWAEFQVGGSYRMYSLNSSGTIFTDADGPINYGEYGLYTQMQKKMSDERLKLTTSIRYDKAQNFDGNFSPRLSLAYAAGEFKNHNFRASIQTGFRNPTTQDQYIGLNSGATILIGTAPENLARYVSTPFALSTGGSAVVTGTSAHENSWTESSFREFAATFNPAALEKSNVSFVKPERVTAYEVGYRGLLGLLTVDFNTYYNEYQDFISSENVITPLAGNVADGSAIPAIISGDYRVVSFYTNSKTAVSSYGVGMGVNTKIFNDFHLGMNYTLSRFEFDQAANPNFEAGFNTPEHKFKVQFGKSELFKNFGFNLSARFQNAFIWESTFLDTELDARTTMDAQVTYKIPAWKSAIKLGGTNLSGQEYFSAPGVGAIGSQYYLSWTFNN